MSPLISSNIGSPLKIAVDWVTGNLYVAQTIYARIDLFSHDGLNRTTLISSDLFTPSSIAVDPAESFLFFTDNGNPRNLRLHSPKIERAFMDGSMRKVDD
jgi:low density lipoprotein receptor-related protein 5/6